MKRMIIIFTAITVGFICIILISIHISITANYEKKIQKMKENNSFTVNIESPVKHKELKEAGYTVHYYTSGDPTKELIVFLHPAFADHRCFDKQIDYFAKEYRIVTIDMLGHGLSKVDKAKDKIDFSINHINSILKLEGYNNAHFVGVSMGTLIAQYYALNHPESVLSLSILGGYDINSDNKEIAKAQRSEQIKWISKAIFSMNSLRSYVSKSVVSQAEEQVRFYEMAGLFTRKSFTVMSGLGKVLQKRENIKRDYPLLILSGDKDIELAKIMSKKWHESELSSIYALIENAGHCANMDNSEDFNRIVMDFIKQKE